MRKSWENHETVMRKSWEICGTGKVDSWNEDIMITEHGEEILVDTYKGKVEMKIVDEKKYLGKLFQMIWRMKKISKIKQTDQLEMLTKSYQL